MLQITLTANGRKVRVTIEPNTSRSASELPYCVKSRNGSYIKDLIDVSNVPGVKVESGHRFSYAFLNGTQLSGLLSGMVPELPGIPEDSDDSEDVVLSSYGPDTPRVLPVLSQISQVAADQGVSLPLPE